MADVHITINGRGYDISCDEGQQQRVLNLASYIDQRMQQVARAGAAYNDSHLMILTAIVLADELFDAREEGGQPVTVEKDAVDQQEAEEVAKIIEHLTKRVTSIASTLEAA